MNPRRLLAALACAVPLAAAAQWQWIDGDGRKVFSDRPPPMDVPPARILRQPGVRPAAAPQAGTQATSQGATQTAPQAATTQAAAAPAAAQPAPKLTGKDKVLEEKKKQAEAAEAAKKKAEEERVAQARSDNCERAQRAKATLESGIRMSTTNARGEIEVMDDEARAREMQRIQRVLASDCGRVGTPRQ